MTVNTTSELNFEEFKKTMKELTLEDVLPIALSTLDFVRNLGNFLKAIGNLQKKNSKASEMMFKVSEEPEAFLTLFVDKVPEDKLKPLVELYLKLSKLQTKMKDFKSLSADEKIQTGEELKQIADEMAKMFEQVNP